MTAIALMICRFEFTRPVVSRRLWFNTEAEKAADNLYTHFKDSRPGRVHRHTEAGPGSASAMLVEFELNGPMSSP